jgi:lipoprotein-anchoring transpeptidase ErfK/SrfK
MIRRLSLLAAGALVLVGVSGGLDAGLAVPARASVASVARVRATLPTSLSSRLPLLRLTFSAPTRASSLPPLVTRPALATKWQQISKDAVQAVATGDLAPATSYTFDAPGAVRCSGTCTFEDLHPLVDSVATNLSWEAQLLAELHYLPLSFTPSTVPATPSEEVNGVFTWAYPGLPSALRDQWSLGTDNVILDAALRTFQTQSSLPVTGEADPTTWNDLVAAANAGEVDPATYNYVLVTMNEPETLTLYVAGKATFRTLVNTGIPEAPTAAGTYPVYARFITTTMSGVNPDGTKYVDPGIPWVSYFHGGDALHGFIRSSYGFPQSLGCVEMPFASAKTVFPYTPIGTLVTVSP